MKQSCCGYFNGILLGILVLIAWFLTSVVIDYQVLPVRSEVLSVFKDILTTGIGAVVGAGAAFLWNKNEKDKDTSSFNAALINKALLELGIQINTVRLIIQSVQKSDAAGLKPNNYSAQYLMPPNDYAEAALLEVGSLIQALPEEAVFCFLCKTASTATNKLSSH